MIENVTTESAEVEVEEGAVLVPVKVDVDDQGLMTLAFGPLPADELALALQYLASEEGRESFLESLKAKLARMQAEREAGE